MRWSARGRGDGKVRIGLPLVTVRFDDGDTRHLPRGTIEERGGAHEVVSHRRSATRRRLLGEVAGTSVTYDGNRLRHLRRDRSRYEG
jgi:hypothetical protein